ncbi:Heterogeneou nuclear ribonucleoprotein U-like protein 1 [Taenia solium]|eukprot:TsM_000210400 transcript=TsM_000210400 gene=TsM_000210400
MDQSFDPNTLKVNDLRDELKRRRLNPIGTKAVLLERLSKVLDGEGKTLQDFAKSFVEANNPTQESGKAVEVDSVVAPEENFVTDPIDDSAVSVSEASRSQSPTAQLPTSKVEDSQLEEAPLKQAEASESSASQTEDDQHPPGEKVVPGNQQDSKDQCSVDERGLLEDQDHSEPRDYSSERDRSSDRDPSRERDFSKERSRHRSRDRNHSRERDRSRGYDHSLDRDKRRTPPRRVREPSISIEDEVDEWEKKEDVFLDMYNSDISLIISQDGFSAKPLTDEGFSLMWAGARTNYGIKDGKCFFEVKVGKELPVDSMESLVGGATHVLRVGWSTDKSGLALGEEANTYGYGGMAKKSTDGKFENYGCEFREGDVVGAFLETTDSEAVMSFSVNGANQGECFRISKSSLDGDFTLFPHVYVKNVEFAVNFGQGNQDAWFPPSDDPDSWNLVNQVPLGDRVRAGLPPSSKAECEVIMMVGLPGSGKTVYANNLCKVKPEKQYNILGTNLILDKMKVTGLARKRNYHGRWDALIDKANQCLNKLISIACKRRRNYILDQRRKMRPFEGFQRRAIVIVPTDEEFKRRIDQRAKEEGKEVPEKAVLEMKANFEIPKSIVEDSSSVFDEVIFPELQRDEAEKLVKQYNAEGKASRQAEKRHRTDSSSHRDYSSGRHGDHREYHHRDHRSRFDGYSRSSGRGEYDRRDSRCNFSMVPTTSFYFSGSGRFDYRTDRGAGGDRGRFGPRYRDEGREFGNREGGRYGGSGRFDNDSDYRSRGRGSYGGGAGAGGTFQRSPRGRGGGGFGGAPFPPDRSSYSGSHYDQYGSDRPTHFNRGGYRGDGGNDDGGNDGYQRGSTGSRGGGYANYGGMGYGYYPPGERRRYEQVGDSSSGPPPAKQPAVGEGQYHGGFQDDGGNYRGGFRGGRGVGGDRGASFGGPRGVSYSQASQGPVSRPSISTYSGSYYGVYGQQQSQQQGLPKGNDSTSTTYPGSGFGRGDEYQKSQQRGSSAFGGNGRASRFSSAAPDDLLQRDSTSSQAVTSRYRSTYTASQGYDGEKDSQSQQSRSRYDQGGSLAQQTQGVYGGGSGYNQQSGGRQPPSTTGPAQDYGYSYSRHQPGGVQPSPQKVQQGYGSDFTNQGASRQQQKSSQQASFIGGYGSGYGGSSGNYGRQRPQTGDPLERYYKGYSEDKPGRGFDKPGQQQSYDNDAYSQRVGDLTNPTTQKFQLLFSNGIQTNCRAMTAIFKAEKHNQNMARNLKELVNTFNNFILLFEEQVAQKRYYQGFSGEHSSDSNKPSQQQVIAIIKQRHAIVRVADQISMLSFQDYGGDVYCQQGGNSSSQSQQNYSGYGQQGTPTKSGQPFQQSFDSGGYNQRSGGHLKSGQSSQRYGGDSGGGSAGSYGQQSSASSKSDPRSYDYSASVNYASYGYGNVFSSGRNAAAPTGNAPVSVGAAAAAVATTPSLYASALSAASKSSIEGTRTATQGYASAASGQLPQASSYGYSSGGYYGGAPSGAGNWPFSANTSVGSSGSQPQQGPIGGSSSTYGYNQRQ